MNPIPLSLVALIVMYAAPVLSDPVEDQDWPCEQALVPEVSAAVVWDGPSIEGLSDQWDSVSEIAEVVTRLTSRRAQATESEELIETFAKTQDPALRNQQLTLLFVGVLDVLNADRSKLNAGITRYSRDQQRRAEALDADLAEMVTLESDPSDAAVRRLEDLRKRIELEQRIFDDREQSIPYLCARPRVVEQRIGELARAIAAQLD